MSEANPLEIKLAYDALKELHKASNTVQEYQATKAAIKHLEEYVEGLKQDAINGDATPDLVAGKEIGVSTSVPSRYSIDMIKEKFGEENLAFALNTSSQTSVRIRNIKSPLKKAA